MLGCSPDGEPVGPGGGGSGGGGSTTAPDAPVVLAEAQSRNDGTWIDETGEVSDWLELYNRSARAVDLSGYSLQDSSGERATLSAVRLEPGQSLVLWADDEPERGALHLPFKLRGDGEEVVLRSPSGEALDALTIPALQVDEVFARFPSAGEPWQTCRFASPGRENPVECAPPAPPDYEEEIHFEPITLPADAFEPSAVVALRQLSLRPVGPEAPFVELWNRGAPLTASDLVVRIAAHDPSQPWPGAGQGDLVPLPAELQELGEGQRLRLTVPAEALAELERREAFEGVVSVFLRGADSAEDRVDFMHWPEGATLARPTGEPLRLCSAPLDGDGRCDVLPSRPVGDRLRHLLTPGDFGALSDGGTTVGIASVKFVSDLRAPGLVHLLGVERWPLHYTFVREQVYREPALDRCDAAENDQFYSGWVEFSRTEYYQSEGRQFLLGTLSRHSGAGIDAVEFALGDEIGTEQMQQAFWDAASHSFDPHRWALHPQDSRQAARAEPLAQSVPVVSPHAPFRGVVHQALTEGVGYGTLRFLAAGELSGAALGPEVIVVTDAVPNDIPLVGGLITEAFQTPLAHVNVLSQSRGTPNASLVGARTKLASDFDTLVRLEVSAEGVAVTSAEPSEAQAYWESLRPPASQVLRPRRDLTVRGVQPLTEHDIDSLPALGAKAAQLAELQRITTPSCGSRTQLETPRAAFALPLVHFVEHTEASGAAALLAELAGNQAMRADAAARNAQLARIRAAIEQQPVQPALLSSLQQAVEQSFGEQRVRLRSSSNTEDLPSFNGAGLYTSVSAALGDEERRLEDALRRVWASLYNARAYEERRLAGIDEDGVAMGVLVHEAFPHERANGVAVSRNLLDPIRGDLYYVNAQAGEASVTNPAPGVGTEQLVYRFSRSPPVLRHAQSTLLSALSPEPASVLSDQEAEDVACALSSVHARFRPLLDPGREDAWFAMEVEFKLLGPERRLLLKQARPHDFGRSPTFLDCREF